MKEIVVKRSDLKDLKIVGELLGETSTKDYRATRWTECALYRTQKGKYILSKVQCTMWEGERDYYTAYIGTSVNDLLEEAFEDGIPDEV
ncbi:MAG: hypothetical protein QXU18_12305, partial [Thermoplasmatales archaeon]